MFRIIVTSEHVRDYVMVSVNNPLQFSTKELAEIWVNNHKNNEIVYKIKDMKPKKAKPMHKKRRRKNKVKIVSLEAVAI